MRLALEGQTRIGWARLAGLAGVVLTLAGLALQGLLMLVLLATGDFPLVEGNVGRLEEIATAHALFALLALLGVLLLRWPVVSALVLLVAFAGSFVAGFGWYFLLTPSPLALAGAGGLLYSVAAIITIVSVVEPSRRET